jgi:hypothetical protein
LLIAASPSPWSSKASVDDARSRALADAGLIG